MLDRLAEQKPELCDRDLYIMQPASTCVGMVYYQEFPSKMQLYRLMWASSTFESRSAQF